jgi:hypothetical protein
MKGKVTFLKKTKERKKEDLLCLVLVTEHEIWTVSL